MMWSMIESLPDQYRWAATLDVPDVESRRSFLVSGMGGSGIAGDFASAMLPGTDVRVHKDYGLPSWAPASRPMVVAVSYSGNTAETLSVAHDALTRGLPVVAICTGGALAELAAERGCPLVVVPGGLQPRAALGYLAGAAVRVLSASAGHRDMRSDLGEAAEEVGRVVGDRSGTGWTSAREIAEQLEGRIPVVWGSAGPAAAIAQRWANQFHENAKVPAFWSLIPELDHNQLVGWHEVSRSHGAHTGIVLIRDRDERPEVARRFELTVDLLGKNALLAGQTWSVGSSPLARAATGAAMGDLTSVLLAESRGVDPVQVNVLEELKKRL